MSNYLTQQNLNGAASWMRMQAQEELTHAMKVFDYIHARGGSVTLTAIEQPPAEWNSALDVFEKAYEHEQKVTKMINHLVDLAIAEKDHASHNMLQWFISEQVEEEESIKSIVERLKLISNAPGALLIMDKELGMRAQAK
ncbi:ferritin [Peptococcaceae bacterium]|nr:ferritin [Peptococcaceae bacterium]